MFRSLRKATKSRQHRPFCLETLENRTVPALSVGITGTPLTAPEGTPISLVGNVSGPSGTGLNYSWQAAPRSAGSTLNFDGVNDYIRLGRPVQDDFTIEAWVRTTASRTGNQFYEGLGLFWADVPGVHNDFGVSVLNGQLAFGTGNPDVTVTSTSTITTGNWVHVAVTRVRSTGVIKVFVNGVEEGSRTSGNTLSLTDSQDLLIGG